MSGVLADLAPAEKSVLLVLAAHAGADSRAWPSVPRLMRILGYSETTVRRALGELRKRGLIVPDGRAGAARPQHGAVRYRLVIEAPLDLPPTVGLDEPDLPHTPGPPWRQRQDPPGVSDTLKNQEKNQAKDQGRAPRSSPPTTQAFDGMEPPPPATGLHPVGIAKAILNDWWATQDQRPQQPYPAALKVVTKALRDGWTETDLRRALPDLPTISGAALDYWRRRHSNGSSRQAPTAEAAEAIARRAMGLDQ